MASSGLWTRHSWKCISAGLTTRPYSESKKAPEGVYCAATGMLTGSWKHLDFGPVSCNSHSLVTHSFDSPPNYSNTSQLKNRPKKIWINTWIEHIPSAEPLWTSPAPGMQQICPSELNPIYFNFLVSTLLKPTIHNHEPTHNVFPFVFCFQIKHLETT